MASQAALFTHTSQLGWLDVWLCVVSLAREIRLALRAC